MFLERLASALEILKIKEFVELETTLRDHLLQNRGYDPSAGCSIIEVGGKRGLKSFADILISFGIPVTLLGCTQLLPEDEYLVRRQRDYRRQRGQRAKSVVEEGKMAQ